MYSVSYLNIKWIHYGTYILFQIRKSKNQKCYQHIITLAEKYLRLSNI